MAFPAGLSIRTTGLLTSPVPLAFCNGLGIMRACLETQKLEQLEARMDEIADDRGRSTNAMSRSQIDRLTRRIEALQAQRKTPEQRIFT